MRTLCILLLAALAGCGTDNKAGSGNESSGGAAPSSPGNLAESPAPDAPAAPDPVEPEKLETLPGEEAQINKVYKDVETLKTSVFGVGFTLPKGLGTAIQHGAEGFVLESTEKQVVGAIYMKRSVTTAEVKEFLSEDQDLGDGVVLARQGNVEEGDGELRAKYGNGTYSGMAIARVGAHGNGIAFFLAAAESDRAYIEQKVEALAKSVRIVAPHESQDEQSWKQMLSGHKLTYLKSSYSGGLGGSYTGGSTNEEITLRADGTFHYYFKDSFSIDASAQGGGAGAYGRDAVEDRGRWKVELAGTNVVLVLAGEQRERRYKLAYSDKKTYLDGSRYFRTPLE
jgi:hypothetical protein